MLQEQYLIKIEPSTEPSFSLTSLPSGITPQMGMMILLLGGVALLSMGGQKKGKLATSYWGGKAEETAAKNKAIKQIKQPERNSAALYIGTPQIVQDKLESEWLKQGLKLSSKPPAKQTYWFPDAQRGCSVVGGAGSGKTVSVLDRFMQSSFDQGFPTIIYDFKYPAQTKRAFAYALKRHYGARIFAPGYPESDTCNILDFLKDEEDAVAAGQLAQVITKNTDLSGGKGGGDKFFEEAGASLTQGVFLLTKATANQAGKPEMCDLMLASAILSLPSLGKRLELARSENKFNVWTMRPLDQIISVSNSPETEASIIGTAQRTFQYFMKKDFIGAFCGQSTLPLDLDGKEVIFFGLDRNNRDIVSPLLAAVLHMIVSRNVSRTLPRIDPLMVFLDEIPTLYLPQLHNWFNENREDGFCGTIAFQNYAQLKQRYGDDLARVIFGGTATKILFNPQEGESNKAFSELLGEFEVEYHTKSRSRGKGSNSRSTSDNRQKRALFEAAQFAKLPTGRAVRISPAFKRGKEAYIPILTDFKLSKADLAEQAWAETRWTEIQENLVNLRSDAISDEVRSRQFEERRKLAEEMFPLPPELSKGNSSGPIDPFAD
ncbi:TraM recognition domain-containing protein [Crocosphaera sp. UHCC 0190]|uniref:type IV secretory system conjugative DNA transfer family protein n=1 Tax=Crocosphaera sp. UHCC 0190 TaxID=3110246 RepID=UPI002B1FE09B|nr:TraM recognition domain-containing protein [Crocosphaera sp. UHCC 0190]MEA5512399.1 TraM recognition domain-containing protein [Crocosphaera sp. UHCC 0190]